MSAQTLVPLIAGVPLSVFVPSYLPPIWLPPVCAAIVVVAATTTSGPRSVTGSLVYAAIPPVVGVLLYFLVWSGVGSVFGAYLSISCLVSSVVVACASPRDKHDKPKTSAEQQAVVGITAIAVAVPAAFLSGSVVASSGFPVGLLASACCSGGMAVLAAVVTEAILARRGVRTGRTTDAVVLCVFVVHASALVHPSVFLACWCVHLFFLVY